MHFVILCTHKDTRQRTWPEQHMYSSEKQTQKEAQDCRSIKHNKRLSFHIAQQ
jgi:hypothetical protein